MVFAATSSELINMTMGEDVTIITKAKVTANLVAALNPGVFCNPDEAYETLMPKPNIIL